VNFVEPQTFLIGHTTVDTVGLEAYLAATGQEDFLKSYDEAVHNGLSPEEALVSFYAKLCYKSLVLGQNANVTRIRDIKDNIASCFKTGHGSVFEHINFNWVTTNCSRVLTHEFVRHRIGTAYSQTSGRYCRIDKIDFVSDPLLADVEEEITKIVKKIQKSYKRMSAQLMDDGYSFALKKKITSALRRIAPNGQANEIGWSVNLRALRHIIMMRTSRHAEREIRLVFNQVYQQVKERWPLMVADATETEVDGLLEIKGMKMQQYDVVLEDLTDEQLIEEWKRRHPEAGYGIGE
jgi:thymidylate synthase (FAD)